MSYDTSLNSRILSAYLLYGGLGLIYGKGRDMWRKIRDITDKSSEKFQQINDAIYAGLFNLVTLPATYVASGATDINEIAIGTATGVIIGGVNGVPLGYSVDLFRDLTGFQKSERVPKFIGERSPIAKRGLAALLLGTSAGLTSLVYSTFT